MITIRISMSWVDPPPRPTLPAGVHSMAEIMPQVLDRYGMSLDRSPIKFSQPPRPRPMTCSTS